jgi:hypothetical protein
MARRPDAECIAILGSRGCGKSTWLRQWLEREAPGRLGLWDVKREHKLAGLVGTDNLAEYVRALRARTWRLAFYPSMMDAKRRAREFEIWCAAMYRAKHCCAVVEELAFMTTPSRAPQAWRTLSLLGRDENPAGGNVTVLATSQRPASIDKDFVGNATLIHCGRLPYFNDADTVARTLGVRADELQQLAPLAWLERGQADSEARRGVLSFAGKKSRAPRARAKDGTAVLSTAS